MMSKPPRRKVIFEHTAASPTEGWVPGCPVQVEVVQVSCAPTRSGASLRFRLQNLTSAVIDEVEYAVMTDLDDGSACTIAGKLTGAGIPVLKDKAFGPIALPSAGVRSAEVTIARVTRPDGAPWRHDPKAADAIGLEELSLPKAAAYERMRQLRHRGLRYPERLRYRHQAADGWWVCSCGTPNVGRLTCRSCGIALADLAALEDEGALERSFASHQGKAGLWPRLCL